MQTNLNINDNYVTNPSPHPVSFSWRSGDDAWVAIDGCVSFMTIKSIYEQPGKPVSVLIGDATGTIRVLPEALFRDCTSAANAMLAERKNKKAPVKDTAFKPMLPIEMARLITRFHIPAWINTAMAVLDDKGLTKLSQYDMQAYLEMAENINALINSQELPMFTLYDFLDAAMEMQLSWKWTELHEMTKDIMLKTKTEQENAFERLVACARTKHNLRGN